MNSIPEDYVLFSIAKKGEPAHKDAEQLLGNFLQNEQKRYDVQILRLHSEPPVRAEIAVSAERKHDLRIGLNLFSAETNTDWKLETLLPSFHA